MAQMQPSLDDNRVEATVGKFKKKITALADWLNKVWLLKVIILFLPVIWSPLILKIDFFSKYLFDAKSGKLNKTGIILGIFIYLLSLSVTILTNFKTQRDQQRKDVYEANKRAMEAELHLWETVTNSECKVERWRINGLSNYGIPLSTGKPIDKEKLLSEGFNPKKHINYILDEIKSSIASLTPVQERQIQMSAAISVDAGQWQWLIRPQKPGMATLEDLLKNNSAFKQVVDGNPFVFYNDKKTASEDKKYYLDQADKAAGNEGSIICWEVDGSYNEKCKTRMIISMSTTEKKLVDNRYEKKEKIVEMFYTEKIKHVILDLFENELIENLLLYRLII